MIGFLTFFTDGAVSWEGTSVLIFFSRSTGAAFSLGLGSAFFSTFSGSGSGSGLGIGTGLETGFGGSGVATGAVRGMGDCAGGLASGEPPPNLSPSVTFKSVGMMVSTGPGTVLVEIFGVSSNSRSSAT